MPDSIRMPDIIEEKCNHTIHETLSKLAANPWVQTRNSLSGQGISFALHILQLRIGLDIGEDVDNHAKKHFLHVISEFGPQVGAD